MFPREDQRCKVHDDILQPRIGHPVHLSFMLEHFWIQNCELYIFSHSFKNEADRKLFYKTNIFLWHSGFYFLQFRKILARFGFFI